MNFVGNVGNNISSLIPAVEVGDHLLGVQPEFKTELIENIIHYGVTLENYVKKYDKNGPMESGIPPREASDRMTIFQSDFDDLWGKFVSYSGGEELFGLSVTPYPELQRIKRELNLLQKLYQLYNQVLESVNGYYDISWADLNTEKINTELTEFQVSQSYPNPNLNRNQNPNLNPNSNPNTKPNSNPNSSQTLTPNLEFKP